MKNRFILYTLLYFAIILLPQQLLAQGQVASRLIRGDDFQIAVGYDFHRVDFKDLNRSIRAAGFPELSEDIHSVSFMAQNISDKWMLTLKTSYAFKNKASLASKEIDYSNQQFSLGLGYNVLTSDKARLLPSLMATLGRNMLLIQDKTSTPANFQSLLQNPAQEADLRNFTYLADAGLAYHYQFYRRERDRETGKRSTWVPLIIKAGYRFQLGESDFKFDGDKVAGVPDISMEGFYASVHIGLGTKLLPAN
ncbi:hypothetical protein ABID22_003131 [Pontibacter aydingkolensis]|uniref:Outer membrane protein beta-barrel domain-containing protein n=1 Tax=Pontibacter aydingkolensis TaxID=1911536 RepID=A0ABS7CY22_9BACT|nr:hypothetical protein [Pontibacter aydingkolensis]MBW7468712.1 hypothetical protein [Pontibacter aydingkolensis]